MTARSAAPSRGDHKGVKRSRMHAAWNSRYRTENPMRVQLAAVFLGQTHAWVFGAYTTDDPPPPAHVGGAGRQVRTPSHIDLAFVHVTCRCGEREVSIRADLVERGYVPRCSRNCREMTPAELLERRAIDRQLAGDWNYGRDCPPGERQQLVLTTALPPRPTMQTRRNRPTPVPVARPAKVKVVRPPKVRQYVPNGRDCDECGRPLTHLNASHRHAVRTTCDWCVSNVRPAK
jgi:hypothetical protein